MNDENEILKFLNKNGLRYLSKFETTEAQFTEVTFIIRDCLTCIT